MSDRALEKLQPVAKFCASSSCCPELLIDHDAAPDRRFVMTDDFGQHIRMSQEQLSAMIADAKSGRLDSALASHGEQR